jgi:Carboxypeptidase regulatory-like domain/TonB dependent receptor/TonB-dependent Receptor Plug Domain
MNNRRTLRQVVVALVMLVVFFSQVTWALAGTTGGLSGQVTDEKGVPVAGAAVKATSAQQTASVTTDAGGHFSFLTLAPDTYTVTAVKDGYAPSSNAGVTVFADQNQTVSVTMPHAGLKNIANVTARSASSLVKPGTTVDVYAVNATTATQLQISNGGNNIDSSLSAVYSMPGVNALPGNFGFGQVFYIHGSSYDQIGYEFDGIPVNRAFDNYNASSLSNLGAQSTEVYTGGGPAAGTAATLGGYINQVIKTGTYPGSITLGAGLGYPAYYHQAQVEAGGATPDRLFSYFVALRGANHIPDQINSDNGGNLQQDGNNPNGIQGIAWNTLMEPFSFFEYNSSRGPWSDCNANGSAKANGSYLSPALAAKYGVTGPMPTCNMYGPVDGGLAANLYGNDLSDRENVMNFHFGVPHHKDSGKDDIQILYDNFYYLISAWDNISTNGGLAFMNAALSPAGTVSGLGNYNTWVGNQFFGAPGNYLGPAQMPGSPGLCAWFNLANLAGGGPPCASTGQSPAPYWDGYQVVNAHFGQSAVGATNVVAPYYFPSTNPNRPFASGFSPYQVSNTANNGSIIKLQYTKNFGSNAFVRLFGYSFYSDWLASDPNAGYTPFEVGVSTPPDYELNTHTTGFGLQAADQLNAQNLITLSGNYISAATMRYNNAQYTFSPNGAPFATLQSASGQCYAYTANNPSPKTPGTRLIDPGYSSNLPAGAPVSCLSALAGATLGQVQAQTLPAIPGAAAAAGANWDLTQNIEPDANRSTTGPRFLNVALQDEFRPSDRWDINAGIRFESYGYALGDYSSPEQQFWFGEINQTACVAPNGLVQAPAADIDGGNGRNPNVGQNYPTYVTTAPGVACPYDPILKQQLFHPGQNGVPAVTLGGNGTITDTTFSPRIGFTYTLSPNNVIRFSYGRYTQPTDTAAEQVLTYLDGYQMATNLYNSAYYNNGYNSIVHNNPIQFSNNWDASFESHLNGTDISYKISPFYRLTSNQSVEVSLPGGLSGSFNSGTEKTQGVELAVSKGDAARNGLSGQLSYTYTFSQLKYSLINGSNIIASLRSTVAPYLGLEGVNGGSPCYVQGASSLGNTIGVPNCSKPFTTTVNGTKMTFTPSEYNENPYYGGTLTQAAFNASYPLTGYYPTYANFFPYGLQQGDAATALSPNIFSGFLTYKHNKWQATLTGSLWEGTQYGSPGSIAGTNPTSCANNQGSTGIVAGSQLVDYQTCSSSIAVPNPYTGQFDGVGQYRNPWEFNLGAQFSYEVTPRIQATVALANILTRCFGGSAEPWTAAYPPSGLTCAYSQNAEFIGAQPGAGYFYGNNPHSAVNGTTGYPKFFDQAYEPGSFQIAAPFQAYFQIHVKM